MPLDGRLFSKFHSRSRSFGSRPIVHLSGYLSASGIITSRPKGFINYSESLQRDVGVSPARAIKMSRKSKILMRSLGIAGKLFSYLILQKQRNFFLDFAGKTSIVFGYNASFVFISLFVFHFPSINII